jgi:exopolyphosphatase/guanosine-5'-triphosphate,3'-diphosphate pyrophosphatase
MALHGNWVGVDGPERAEMAMALHVALGGNPDAPPAILSQLTSAGRLARAQSWGLAMRLAQRLSGGSPGVLAALPLSLAQDGAVLLGVPHNVAGLVDAAVERRLARLALSLGREARIENLPGAAYAPENARPGGGLDHAPAA